MKVTWILSDAGRAPGSLVKGVRGLGVVVYMWKFHSVHESGVKWAQPSGGKCGTGSQGDFTTMKSALLVVDVRASES